MICEQNATNTKIVNKLILLMCAKFRNLNKYGEHSKVTLLCCKKPLIYKRDTIGTKITSKYSDK